MRDISDRLTKLIAPGGGWGETTIPAIGVIYDFTESPLRVESVTQAHGTLLEVTDSDSFSSGESIDADEGEERAQNETFTKGESVSIVNT